MSFRTCELNPIEEQPLLLDTKHRAGEEEAKILTARLQHFMKELLKSLKEEVFVKEATITSSIPNSDGLRIVCFLPMVRIGQDANLNNDLIWKWVTRLVIAT